MKNYKTAQQKYDDMSDDDDVITCPVCSIHVVVGPIGVVQCKYCGWEQDDDE